MSLKKALLYCGIASSLLYVLINIIVPFKFPGYKISSQTVSELSAIDAPSRQLWVVLCAFYSLLVIAFGVGIWLCVNGRKGLRIVATLMLIYGVSGYFWPPMHQRVTLAAGGGSMSDTMHIAFAIGTVMLMVTMIILSRALFGERFRIYSIVTLVAFLVFGTLTALDGPRITKNLATPFLGIWERVNIGVFLAWVIVLALELMRRRRSLVVANDL
jgi:hypothetical protein